MEIDKRTVSIIVPCFLYGKYLEECIDSIVNQTHKAHEIIIVNDGSPDNTSEVALGLIEKYPDEDIILLGKKNGGLSSARNAGIEIATGEFIQCIDADDKVLPGCIEVHLSLIGDDKTISQAALMEFGDRHVIMVPTSPTGLERIMQSNTIFCNAMFPRRAWEEIGGFDEHPTMRYGYEDWEAWIRMLDKGYKVRTSDFIALRYRVHKGQMTEATAHPKRQILYEYIFNKHRDLYEKKGLTIAGMT